MTDDKLDPGLDRKGKLYFKDEFVDGVLSGEKRFTVRYGSDGMFHNVCGINSLRTEDDEEFGIAYIPYSVVCPTGSVLAAFSKLEDVSVRHLNYGHRTTMGVLESLNDIYSDEIDLATTVEGISIEDATGTHEWMGDKSV